MSPGEHARWFRHQLTDARILDVGATETSNWGWRSFQRQWWRHVALPGALAIAAVCTAVGTLLAVGSTDVRVSMDSTTYQIGSATLRAVAPNVYVGDGVLVLSGSEHERRAASSAMVNGQLWLGVCEVAAVGMSETCQLHTGGDTITAQDVWSHGEWQRRYSDGQRVLITASRGVPVPFPVGR